MPLRNSGVTVEAKSAGCGSLSVPFQAAAVNGSGRRGAARTGEWRKDKSAGNYRGTFGGPWVPEV